MKERSNIVPIAIVFEMALGLGGALIASGFHLPLQSRLILSAEVALRSVLATLPMLLLLAYLTSTRWRPLAELRRQVETLVGELFRNVSLLGLAAVATAAGVGEELLFRGALQPLAERWWGPTAGLVAVSLFFGALHAASMAYFVLATLVGLYLGWLAQRYDDLVAPIFAHAAYDFAALLVLQRNLRTTGNA